MAITQEERIALIDLIGPDVKIPIKNGVYFIPNGPKTSSVSTVLKSIGVNAQSLKAAGLFRLAIDFKDLTPEIAAGLVGDVFFEPAAVSMKQDTEIVGEGDSAWLVRICQDIALFKTVKDVGYFDPKARDGVSLIAFNTQTRKLLSGFDLSINSLLAMLGTDRRSAILSDEVPWVWPVFNPYCVDIRFMVKGSVLHTDEHPALNTFVPPTWMSVNPAPSPRMGKFISRLVTHLFPNEDERELVLDWCRYAIFDRNNTVLCLAGDRGTGKSTFIEILGELVGTHYTETVSQSILEDKFNAQFLDKRLLVFEEVALDEPSSLNKIKAWCNDRISIEQKGANAFSAINHSSMVFLMNDLQQLRVGSEERRFSIPVVAEESLLRSIPEQEISLFKEGISKRDPKVLRELAEFGEFLKARTPKNSSHVPIRGENFNRVADLSLSAWKLRIRDVIIEIGKEEEPIPLSVFFPKREQEKRDGIRPPGEATIRNFLSMYRYLGVYKIGTIVEVEEKDDRVDDGLPKKRSATKKLGIVPRTDFIKKFGKGYKVEVRGEDLL